VPIELTGQQAEAADAIRTWFIENQWAGGSLTLGGYAGTGKTTMLGKLPEILPRGIHIVYASFTGKAVSVMRQKLPPGSECMTLHKLLYMPRHVMVCIVSGEEAAQFGLENANDAGKLIQNDRGRVGVANEPGRPFITDWFCYPHHPGTKPENKNNAPCEVRKALDFTPVMNPLDGIDLVIVNEASMVSEKIWRDLTKWGVPVLAVGDHGQLPPVKSQFNLMERPQIRLEQVLRQAEGSPIIRMATLARTTARIPIGDYGPGCVKLPPFKRAQALSHLRPENGDLALCSFNRTRNWLNTTLRKRVVAPPNGDPVVGDLVICLRNSYEAGVFNGMRGRITELGPVMDYYEHPRRFAGVQLLDEDYEFEGELATEQFNQPKTLNEISRGVTLWDYGYAMTVHKSQGSQADRVMVIEERFPHDDDAFHARLLYTAVTRAARSLCVVGPA
jgi:Mesyanzhinovviridae Dda-like helicase